MLESILSIFKKDKKIGLALGSGAARGIAHIGVFKAIKEKNLEISEISGSSMGAFVGAYYAKHKDISGLETIAVKLDFNELIKLIDPNFLLLWKGLVSGKKVEQFLEMVIGNIDFKDLKIPLSVVATDIKTGKAVVINKGSVLKAIRASLSIPTIFTPIEYQGKFLIDGGVTNPVPVDILEKKGCDVIIASNVITRPSLFHSEPLSETKEKETKNLSLDKLNTNISKSINENNNVLENIKKSIDDILNNQNKAGLDKDTSQNTPSIFETLLSAIDIMEYRASVLSAKRADIVIAPDLRHIASMDFLKAKEAVEQGYKEAIKIIEKNRKKLF